MTVTEKLIPQALNPWDLLIKVMVPVSIAYFSWSMVTVLQMDKRVSVIESNRYTHAMALEFERETTRRFHVLSEAQITNTADLKHIRETLMRIERELQKP